MAKAVLVEVPDAVWDAMQRYKELHPRFDDDRLATAALCLFLMQDNGIDTEDLLKSRQLSGLYLDCLFKKELTRG